MKTERIGPKPHIAVDHDGAGELVLLLHGVGGNRRNWRDNIQAIAERFKVVAWDARGWGDSDDYEGPLSLADMSDDIARVLDHFGADKAHIVGLSMGGRNAMHFATTYRQRVSSLVLCDTLVGFSIWSEEKKAEFVRARKEPLLNGQEPADIAGPIARALVSPMATEEAIEQLADSFRRLHKHMYIKAIEMLVREPDQGDLGSIAVPALVLVGEDDPITPIAETRQIAEGIPGARFVIVPGAGHLLNIEKADAFNALVVDFLSGAAGN
nr:alpha/beta fold hydrolase [Sphingomonas sp. Y57]